MRIVGRTERFKKMYKRLSPPDRARVDAALLKLATDPWHPSLRTGKLEPKERGIWYCRASRTLRIMFSLDGDDATLRTVGPHSILDR